MARPKLNVVVLDPGSGKAKPGAWVTFYLANTLTPASLFADDDVSSIANPVQANQLGQVAVRISPGLYDISMSWDGAQPTVVEDILAYTPETAVLTEAGDLIIGGHIGPGDPARRAIGTMGQVLTVMPSGDFFFPFWRTLRAGEALPAGAQGSILSYGSTGLLVPILPGLQDQALAMAGGVPSWVSTLIPPGTTLPISQPGDLVVGAVTTGLPARLAKGNPDDVLTTNEAGTGLVWAPGSIVARGRGDGVLQVANTQTLQFRREKGSEIWINGKSRTIPAAGITLSPAALTEHTTYYIYVEWTGTTMQLIPSTTGYVYNQGLYHRSGDPARTLVGMARVVEDKQWTNQEKRRFCLSFFHGAGQAASGHMTAPRSTSSQTFVEVSAECSAEFLSWADSAIQVGQSGIVMHSTGAGAYIYSQTAVDGNSEVGLSMVIQPANHWMNISTTAVRTLTEGYHRISFHGRTTAGTATWWGEASDVWSTRVSALIGSQRT